MAVGSARSRRRRRLVPLFGLVALVAVVLFARASNFATGGSPSSPSTATGATPGEGALDPSEFEPGSCVAMAPTRGNHDKTVFLDAGHGGLDPGGIGTTESGVTIYEADETLPVELDAALLLRSDGYRVVVSRTRQTTVARPQSGDLVDGDYTVQGEHRDVASRDQCANLGHADALIGIYFDAGGSEQDAGSITGYDTARSFAAANLRLAELVQRDVLAAMNAHGWGIPDDGVVSDVSLGGPALSSGAHAYGHLLLLGPADPGYFDTPSTMPGALIEPLFITDPFEGSIADSSSGQHAIASGLAEAAEQFLSPVAPAHSRSASTTR